MHLFKYRNVDLPPFFQDEYFEIIEYSSEEDIRESLSKKGIMSVIIIYTKDKIARIQLGELDLSEHVLWNEKDDILYFEILECKCGDILDRIDSHMNNNCHENCGTI